eukprot:GFKZ01010926.1.p1 GENE.GFKZ01010926.1~~GFKZ01010926.1.p1  ORF type:complete len:424 (+),score=52.24 GFKZ01010926.1:560-1831(+)
MAMLRHGPPVFHSGWLDKEGNNGSRWERFMRLSGTALSNSHSERTQPTWEISLIECPVNTGPRPLEFTIKLKKRLLSYFARSEEDFVSWQDAFRRALEMTIDRFYRMGHMLGEGAFAQVVIGEDAERNDKVAIKIINKDSYDVREMQFIMREVKIMMAIAHNNIVNTYDIFDSRKKLYLVIEYMEGGELFDIIADQGHLSEQRASQVVREIIKGVDYLHEVGVVHCDIKPENILCKSRSWPLQIKLCDFGLANFYDKYNDSNMTAMIGTPGYVAPEVVQRKPYGPPVDMWACGVVLYVMLSGRMPFYGKDDVQCLRMTANGDYSFPDREWKHVSEDAKSLVRALLQIRPELRLTAKAALQHKWLATPQELSTTPLQNDLSQIHSKVRQRFRKAVNAVHTIERMKDLISGLSSRQSNGTGPGGS